MGTKVERFWVAGEHFPLQSSAPFCLSKYAGAWETGKPDTLRSGAPNAEDPDAPPVALGALDQGYCQLSC